MSHQVHNIKETLTDTSKLTVRKKQLKRESNSNMTKDLLKNDSGHHFHQLRYHAWLLALLKLWIYRILIITTSKCFHKTGKSRLNIET